MNYITCFINLGTSLLIIVAISFITIIVMKTEKELKKVFELFFVSNSILFLASVFSLNKIFGIINSSDVEMALVVSRFLALLFTSYAYYTMAKLVKNIQTK